MSSPTNTQELEDSLWVKWRLPALVAVGILAVLIILYVARGSLLPIIISVIVAELLFPIVSYIEGLLPGHERYPRVARIFTIALVYILFFALVAALLYLTFQPVIKEAQEFIETAPEIYEQAKVTIEGLVEEFNQRVPDEVKAQLDELLQSASGLVSEAALAILAKTLSSITGTISIVIGLVIVPFLLFYMLKDKEELVGGMYSVLPKDVARHTHNVFGRIHGVIGSYVRAQLISAIIVGVFVFLGLLLLDISFALTLGLLAGVLWTHPHHRRFHRSGAGTAGHPRNRSGQIALGCTSLHSCSVRREQHHLAADPGPRSQASSNFHNGDPDNSQRHSRTVGGTYRRAGGCSGQGRVRVFLHRVEKQNLFRRGIGRPGS